MRTRTIVVGGLVLAFGLSRTALGQEHPTEQEHEHEHEAEAPPPEAQAAETEAFARARPVFERFCFDCHTTAGSHHDDEALEHISMDAYPFTGEHAAAAAAAVRDVLGATGHPATMPKNHPGAVAGDDLALVLAWAEAFDQEHALSPEEMAHMAQHEHLEHQAAFEHGDCPPGRCSPPEVPFTVPRENMIPGHPGMPGGFHFMLNAYGYAQNVGLSGYTIDNPGAGSFDAGATRALLSGDWIMGYGRDAHGWVEGLLMLNFEPLTNGAAGYPELGQQGEDLWDAQHPHQLLHQAMVAIHPLAGTRGGAVTMEHEGRFDLSVFFGQGSATLGPPVFMHRASAPGPTVPRKHHKGENPHETFPVAGASFRYGSTWIEASVFSALELTPQDSRLYPHLGTMDSFAARVRHELGGWLEVQASGARLNDQGNGTPNAWQFDASAYAWVLAHGWSVDALVDWAIDLSEGQPAAHGLLGEVAFRDPSAHRTLWLRGEVNQREEPAALGGGVSGPWLFGTVGFEELIWHGAGLNLGLFGEATYARIPDTLAARYGRSDATTLVAGFHVLGMWMLDGSLHDMGHHHHEGGGEMRMEHGEMRMEHGEMHMEHGEEHEHQETQGSEPAPAPAPTPAPAPAPHQP